MRTLEHSKSTLLLHAEVLESEVQRLVSELKVKERTLTELSLQMNAEREALEDVKRENLALSGRAATLVALEQNLHSCQEELACLSQMVVKQTEVEALLRSDLQVSKRENAVLTDELSELHAVAEAELKLAAQHYNEENSKPPCHDVEISLKHQQLKVLEDEVGELQVHTAKCESSQCEVVEKQWLDAENQVMLVASLKALEDATYHEIKSREAVLAGYEEVLMAVVEASEAMEHRLTQQMAENRELKHQHTVCGKQKVLAAAANAKARDLAAREADVALELSQVRQDLLKARAHCADLARALAEHVDGSATISSGANGPTANHDAVTTTANAEDMAAECLHLQRLLLQARSCIYVLSAHLQAKHNAMEADAARKVLAEAEEDAAAAMGLSIELIAVGRHCVSEGGAASYASDSRRQLENSHITSNLPQHVDQGTQPEPCYLHVDQGTQPEPCSLHVDQGTQPEPCNLHVDQGTQPEPYNLHVDQGTQPELCNHHVDQGTQPEPCSLHVDQGTQPEACNLHVNQGTQPEPYNLHVDQGTQPEPSSLHVDEGTQPEPCNQYVDQGSQPEPCSIHVDQGTEPEICNHHVDQGTQPEPCYLHVDQGTQPEPCYQLYTENKWSETPAQTNHQSNESEYWSTESPALKGSGTQRHQEISPHRLVEIGYEQAMQPDLHLGRSQGGSTDMGQQHGMAPDHHVSDDTWRGSVESNCQLCAGKQALLEGSQNQIVELQSQEQLLRTRVEQLRKLMSLMALKLAEALSRFEEAQKQRDICTAATLEGQMEYVEIQAAVRKVQQQKLEQLAGALCASLSEVQSMDRRSNTMAALKDVLQQRVLDVTVPGHSSDSTGMVIEQLLQTSSSTSPHVTPSCPTQPHNEEPASSIIEGRDCSCNLERILGSEPLDD
ncbi:hypothetical protein CEUSTIGMA_g268.t1 [Chlamydomonas eustigma]|uniref:Uncharacterized protein n=1 Tax=Chlamydomonas eustigma TaxID=1157962 RepID=A0A250WPR9_9CHLO|nr:hypothetical protein CEUSTIGMA_g268.t1 [Chlamydomonas eustigma]|eukprot:GAX72813.1 hypothetical protein CEUSTIGMA_g268.t1 [Chlamydomonas eustigma]